MGVLTDGIADAKQKDYSIAFKILINKISGTQDIVGKLRYYDSEEVIIEDFITHRVDYIVINPLFYLKNQTKLDEDILYCSPEWVCQFDLFCGSHNGKEI